MTIVASPTCLNAAYEPRSSSRNADTEDIAWLKLPGLANRLLYGLPVWLRSAR